MPLVPLEVADLSFPYIINTFRVLVTLTLAVHLVTLRS